MRIPQKEKFIFTIKIGVCLASELLNGLDFAFPDKPQYIHDVCFSGIYFHLLYTKHKRKVDST